MAARRTMQIKDRIAGAARAAVVALGLLMVIPAAATPPHILCSENEKPDLHVEVETLTTATVNHSFDTRKSAQQKSAVLKPLAREAIKDVFSTRPISTIAESNEAEKETPEVAEPESEPPRAMNTRLPGVTEERLLRYKKQMYRRDI